MLVAQAADFLPDSPQKEQRLRRPTSAAMKLFLEIIVAAILHPVAVVLMWINLAGRDDLNGTQKGIWAVVGLIWGIGPILYILVGDGLLW
jgi:hypothetical protein